MRKRTVGLALSLLLLPLTALAHEHSAECFVGGSGESGSFLRGTHAWVDWQKGPKRWSWMVDISTHAGGHTREGVRETREETTLSIAGARVTLGSPGSRFVPSFHVLPLGVQFVKSNGGKDRVGGVTLLGGGLDYVFSSRNSVEIGIRGQVEYVLRHRKGEEEGWRGSFGLVTRFLKDH